MTIESIESIEEKLKAAIPGGVVGVTRDTRRIYVDVNRTVLRQAARTLIELGARYQVGIGYDTLAENKTLSLIHSFCFDKPGVFVALRTSAPEHDPSFESITPDIPGADWSERECFDLLGMTFTGHPNPKRLILSDDWPEGIYPMRKEVPWNLMPPPADKVAFQLDEAPAGTTVVPVGPFHPTLHEPEHFAVYVDGETIKGCEYRGFMVHRGIEKLCQTQVSYNEIPFIAERICGICGSVHAAAYSQAVELASGLRISRRAEYIRTIMLEIERVHSHLLWLGIAGHLIGFDTVFMQAWRVREALMWFGEKLTGNRKTYGMIVVGGVRRDVTPDLREELLTVIKKIETELVTIHKAVANDSLIHRRTKGVGTITKEQAIKYGLVGPVARARGVDIDVRRDVPYAAYDAVKFDVPVVDSCDVWGTLVVRILETFEAIKIIRQSLADMPDGALMTEYAEELKPGNHAVMAVEAPRGESVHYLITGENNRPERWRVRAPTYPNLQGVPLMLMDEQFADLPIIIGSIDPCFSCTDRLARIDVRSGDVVRMTGAELEALALTATARK
ncbi:MAG: NADH-quinone oxidoreductase subunit C [Spirochaetes bacterium]|nr:NADH-quinone oxidoreductase subunit C [Spirochaetota bacterium]